MNRFSTTFTGRRSSRSPTSSSTGVWSAGETRCSSAGWKPWERRPIAVHDQPDAGLWELRGRLRVHTFSAVMCWAACDRLAKIAAELGLAQRVGYWRERADRIHATICRRAWNENKTVFHVRSFDEDTLDASVLLLHDVGFLTANDPRFSKTVAAMERELKRGDYVYRYIEADDFGVPENAFVICTFWYIYALAALGRMEEACGLFENMLPSVTGTGFWPSISIPRPVNSGEISSRPTAWWD